MNRILISILGVIVIGVSLYYIVFQSGNEGATAELEAEELQVAEQNEDESRDRELEAAAHEKGQEQVLQQVAYQQNQEQIVKEIIARQHHYLNNLAGWGNAENMDPTALVSDKEWKQLHEDIVWLKEDGFANSAVVTDIENAQQLFEVASTGDTSSLLYLHRTFHDLDAEMNDQEVDKIWNVTHAFGKPSEQEQLLSYLTEEQTE
ncbi:hypothetical protein N0O92_07645 [Alkalihalobacillus sp. MEB130]|uniref:hypothetical protein n=1 Tax=Alkalihalobacillus sp. MEB130 TaxID=2976704 RepID=UPI0028E062C3|nr:hypothetical protein [Alkalihalobacillus sp. MEB130]MDT8860105.1 hypothetical protein [Alkalihalobacillus sp. MEB130]